MKLPSPKQREFFETAVASYAKQLADDTAAQEYLMGRGISAEAAGMFRLGVAREPLVGHEMYRDRLCIPYLTPAGVVNFTFRCIARDCARCSPPEGEKGHSKYLAPPMDRNLYNMMALEYAEEQGIQTIHITEGELDALVLTTCGLLAIGIPGVDNWQDHWHLLFADFAEVYVWGDPDKAGRRFSHRMEKELRARQVALPPGKDVNAVYIDGGPAALHALVGA